MAGFGPKSLVRVADLRGDLHTHTDLTDGIVSLAGMIAAAEARGSRPTAAWTGTRTS